MLVSQVPSAKARLLPGFVNDKSSRPSARSNRIRTRKAGESRQKPTTQEPILKKLFRDIYSRQGSDRPPIAKKLAELGSQGERHRTLRIRHTLCPGRSFLTALRARRLHDPRPIHLRPQWTSQPHTRVKRMSN